MPDKKRCKIEWNGYEKTPLIAKKTPLLQGCLVVVIKIKVFKRAVHHGVYALVVDRSNALLRLLWLP